MLESNPNETEKTHHRGTETRRELSSSVEDYLSKLHHEWGVVLHLKTSESIVFSVPPRLCGEVLLSLGGVNLCFRAQLTRADIRSSSRKSGWAIATNACARSSAVSMPRLATPCSVITYCT